LYNCTAMRPSRTQPPRDDKHKGPYGHAFYFAGQYPLPMWMQHTIVACGLVLVLLFVPVIIALGIKNVSDGKPPVESRSARIGRHIEEQRERNDPAMQAKQKFLAEQADRPVLDITAYEKMSTTDLIGAINHAGPARRLTVVRTLALSRNTALRLLPWCNTQLERDPGQEHATHIWRAAVKLSGCDAAETPSDWLRWESVLGLPGAAPMTSAEQSKWACVLDAAAAEESAFERRAAEIRGPE
jgi:hypothetical protein